MWKTVTIKYVGLYIPDDFSLIAVQWKRGILLRLCAIYFFSWVHFSLETVITYDASIFVDHACLRTFFSLPNSFYPKARNCFWRLGEPKLGYRCAWVHRHWRCFFLNRRKRLAEYGTLYQRTGMASFNVIKKLSWVTKRMGPCVRHSEFMQWATFRYW